jgi:hypothetical protein
VGNCQKLSRIVKKVYGEIACEVNWLREDCAAMGHFWLVFADTNALTRFNIQSFRDIEPWCIRHHSCIVSKHGHDHYTRNLPREVLTRVRNTRERYGLPEGPSRRCAAKQNSAWRSATSA